MGKDHRILGETFKMNRKYFCVLHRLQQAKMKDLWDNLEDDAWEHA
jgi:hypothetical protein